MCRLFEELVYIQLVHHDEIFRSNKLLNYDVGHIKMYYIIGRYNPNIELFLDILYYPIITVTFEEIQKTSSGTKESYKQCLKIARAKMGRHPIEIITTFDNVLMSYDGETKGTMVSEELSFLPHDSILPTTPVERVFTALYHPTCLFDEALTKMVKQTQSLMVIPSILTTRSIFSKEERMEQTLRQAESIYNVTGPKPTTILVEMSHESDLTSYDVFRLKKAFDVVLLAYKDKTLMEYVHKKSNKSISEAYVFMALLKLARSSGSQTLIKFGGRYQFDHFPYYGILTANDSPTIRYGDSDAFAQLYSIPKNYYDTYEKHLKKMLLQLLEDETSLIGIETMLYEFAIKVKCNSIPRLYIRGYNSEGEFSLL